ncbi:hypothetical protein E2C01_068023 [Portunus trituberculatus]|uniref:Uncharacterized protein n=1 Tax=Portunus trituberculatus TaxID=210409 RepID=A0A5B7HYD2_PORTR|nr:hypothetical protein [Portunus trituberculatus]
MSVAEERRGKTRLRTCKVTMGRDARNEGATIWVAGWEGHSRRLCSPSICTLTLTTRFITQATVGHNDYTARASTVRRGVYGTEERVTRGREAGRWGEAS